MSIDSRLRQLEKQASESDSDECACAVLSCDIRTYMDAEDNKAAAVADVRPPEICQRCDKPKGIIKVIVVYGQNPHASADARA